MDGSEELSAAAGRLADLLAGRGMWLATAESCTGGLIACELTNLPGSSAWYLGGVVAYANSLKVGLLDVPEAILAEHGAVSRQTVLAMALGACARLGADCSLAVSGIAGPSGGTPEKPVGTVWIGWAVGGRASAEGFLFPGDRLAVKRSSALAAMEGLARLLD